MKVLLIIDSGVNPIDVSVVKRRENEEHMYRTYYRWVRWMVSNQNSIFYDEEEEERVKALTDQEIIDECDYQLTEEEVLDL